MRHAGPPVRQPRRAPDAERRRILRRGALGAVAFGLAGLGFGSTARLARAAPLEVREGDSLQAAIDAAEPGGTVRVGPGAYHETVIIEKPLTLVGAGYRRTVLSADRGAIRWAGLPRERYVVGAINVRSTQDVRIAGFTVRDALEGVWVSASRRVRVSDCMSCEHDSSGYYLWASQDCTVEHCEGLDNAVGIYQGNSIDIGIDRNVFRNNRGGDVPHLDDDHYPGIGILMGNVSLRCTAIGNRLVDNLDWGAGISLGVREVDLIGNEISGNDTGVFVGERGVRMHANAIEDNARYGVDGGGVEVDARHNWWGAASGPSGAGPGRGDAVTPGVLVRPWRREPVPLPSAGPREDPLP